MTEKRIIYTENNQVHIVVPQQPDADMQALAARTVPAGLPYRIVDAHDIPTSRQWRNAWTDENETASIDIDLDRAKSCHLDLMVAKARERVTPDAFGQQDFTAVNAEITAIDFGAITSLQALYNSFPPSIDMRQSARSYAMHESPAETE